MQPIEKEGSPRFNPLNETDFIDLHLT